MTDGEVAGYLGAVGELVRPDGTLIDHDEFLDDIARIRRRGFSTARGEREPGMASVAAVVADPAGRASAAVQIAGTQDEMPQDRVEQFGTEVRRAALAVARRLF